MQGCPLGHIIRRTCISRYSNIHVGTGLSALVLVSLLCAYCNIQCLTADSAVLNCLLMMLLGLGYTAKWPCCSMKLLKFLLLSTCKSAAHLLKCLLIILIFHCMQLVLWSSAFGDVAPVRNQ